MVGFFHGKSHSNGWFGVPLWLRKPPFGDGSKSMNSPYDWGKKHPITSCFRVPGAPGFGPWTRKLAHSGLRRIILIIQMVQLENPSSYTIDKVVQQENQNQAILLEGNLKWFQSISYFQLQAIDFRVTSQLAKHSQPYHRCSHIGWTQIMERRTEMLAMVSICFPHPKCAPVRPSKVSKLTPS